MISKFSATISVHYLRATISFKYFVSKPISNYLRLSICNKLNFNKFTKIVYTNNQIFIMFTFILILFNICLTLLRLIKLFRFLNFLSFLLFNNVLFNTHGLT